jgi:hypothetical protein
LDALPGQSERTNPTNLPLPRRKANTLEKDIGEDFLSSSFFDEPYSSSPVMYLLDMDGIHVWFLNENGNPVAPLVFRLVQGFVRQRKYLFGG